ncbi:MAG: glycosyltransferase [Candidatus Eisenbacteria bacterium]
MGEPDARAPRVSTIIPCYNGERFIGKAIESVLGQTYRDLEVVVVDDGSSDGSLDVVGRYMSDGRVKLTRHETNKGIPAARNTGLGSSTGEFVAFLDQDDMWVPGKLEAQVPVLDEGPPDLGMVFSDIVMIDDHGTRLGLAQGREIPRNIGRMSRHRRLRALYLRNFIPLISVLARRTCLDGVGRFDESIRGGMDDYDLCLRIVPDWDVALINEPLAVHRVHEGSYSKDVSRLVADAPKVMDRLVGKYRFLEDLKPRRQARYHVALAMHQRDAGNAVAARDELRRAIASDPTWLTPYLSYALTLTGRAGHRALAVRRRLRAGGTPEDARGDHPRRTEDDPSR